MSSGQISLFPEADGAIGLRDAAELVRLAGIEGLPQAIRRADDAKYQEVRVKSALTEVRGMPFRWALNSYRGCTHACQYCYARKYQRHLELNAGDDFSRGKWLDHVIVRAGLERCDPVGFAIAARQNDDRREVARSAQVSDQIEAAPVRQHQIQNDQIGMLGSHGCIGAGAGNVDTEAVASQCIRNHFGNRRLVFDDQNASAHQRLVNSRTSGAAADTNRSRCSGTGRVPAK